MQHRPYAIWSTDSNATKIVYQKPLYFISPVFKSIQSLTTSIAYIQRSLIHESHAKSTNFHWLIEFWNSLLTTWVFSDHKFCMKLAIFDVDLGKVSRFVLIWGDRRSDETFYIVQWWNFIRCAKFGFGNRWNVFKSLYLNSTFIIMFVTYCRLYEITVWLIQYRTENVTG